MSRFVTFAAISAFALNLGAARAEEGLDRVILKLNGHVNAVGAYIDQSTMGDLDRATFDVDTGLYGSAVLPFDDGTEIGGRVALDLDYATNIGSFLNEAGRSSILDELWVYWDSGFGRFQLGLMDGAANLLGTSVPSVSGSVRVDNPEILFLAFPCQKSIFCSSDSGLPGSLFSPNGMQLRTDVHGSNNYLKIMYATPVFDGIRIAVSYTPDSTRNPGDLFGDDLPNEQGDIVDVAANYVGTLGDIDVAASIGYVTGTNLNRTNAIYGDLEDFGAGLKLGYREWTFGTAFRQTNVAGGGPVVGGFFDANVFKDVVTDVWSFGLMYERGPWAASANYITMKEKLPFFVNSQTGNGLQFSLGYTINENLRLNGGYQHYEFEGPFKFCSNNGFSCDTLDANTAYLETAFSF